MLQEEALRFSMLLFIPQSYVNRNLKFFTFDEDDLVDGFSVKMRQSDAAFSDSDGCMDFSFPALPGYCRVGQTLFLVGGICSEAFRMKKNIRGIDSDLLLSFNPDASPPPGDSPSPGLCHWRCNSLFFGRQQCVAVPYDSKIFIFGGIADSNALIEIYDTLSGDHFLKMDFPEVLDPELPTSYFLWKDSRNPHKKPLIMLYYPDPSEHHRLYSYDVEENRWELFDDDFFIPGPIGSVWPRNLIPLDCSDYLVVMDYAAYWSIYDLSSKKLVGMVTVQGLDKDWEVIRAFWRRCSNKRGLIFYIFCDGNEGNCEVIPNRVPYAKVRLLTEGQEFVATLESTGVLEVEKYVYICMFAEQYVQSLKRATSEKQTDGSSGPPVQSHRGPRSASRASPSQRSLQHSRPDPSGHHNATPASSPSCTGANSSPPRPITRQNHPVQ